MAAAEDDELLPRLPDLFETGQQLLDEVEVAAEPTGSRAVQDKVSKGLDLLKTAAEMLSQLDLFRYGGRAGRAPRVQPPGLGCGAGGAFVTGPPPPPSPPALPFLAPAESLSRDSAPQGPLLRSPRRGRALREVAAAPRAPRARSEARGVHTRPGFTASPPLPAAETKIWRRSLPRT